MKWTLQIVGFGIAALLMQQAAWAVDPSSPFYDPPIWDRDGGPSIYNTYDFESGAQPKRIVPKDNALGRDSFGVPRRRVDQRSAPDETYFDSVGKACGRRSTESKCN